MSFNVIVLAFLLVCNLGVVSSLAYFSSVQGEDCTQVLRECSRHSVCDKLWRHYRASCKVGRHECLMKNRTACFEAYEYIRKTPLFECKCDTRHEAHGFRCHRIQLLIEHNRCVDEIYHRPHGINPLYIYGTNASPMGRRPVAGKPDAIGESSNPEGGQDRNDLRITENHGSDDDHISDPYQIPEQQGSRRRKPDTAHDRSSPRTMPTGPSGQQNRIRVDNKETIVDEQYVDHGNSFQRPANQENSEEDLQNVAHSGNKHIPATTFYSETLDNQNNQIISTYVKTPRPVTPRQNQRIDQVHVTPIPNSRRIQTISASLESENPDFRSSQRISESAEMSNSLDYSGQSHHSQNTKNQLVPDSVETKEIYNKVHPKYKTEHPRQRPSKERHRPIIAPIINQNPHSSSSSNDNKVQIIAPQVKTHATKSNRGSKLTEQASGSVDPYGNNAGNSDSDSLIIEQDSQIATGEIHPPVMLPGVKLQFNSDKTDSEEELIDENTRRRYFPPIQLTTTDESSVFQLRGNSQSGERIAGKQTGRKYRPGKNYHQIPYTNLKKNKHRATTKSLPKYDRSTASGNPRPKNAVTTSPISKSKGITVEYGRSTNQQKPLSHHYTSTTNHATTLSQSPAKPISTTSPPLSVEEQDDYKVVTIANQQSGLEGDSPSTAEWEESIDSDSSHSSLQVTESATGHKQESSEFDYTTSSSSKLTTISTISSVPKRKQKTRISKKRKQSGRKLTTTEAPSVSRAASIKEDSPTLKSVTRSTATTELNKNRSKITKNRSTVPKFITTQSSPTVTTATISINDKSTSSGTSMTRWTSSHSSPDYYDVEIIDRVESISSVHSQPPNSDQMTSETSSSSSSDSSEPTPNFPITDYDYYVGESTAGSDATHRDVERSILGTTMLPFNENGRRLTKGGGWRKNRPGGLKQSMKPDYNDYNYDYNTGGGGNNAYNNYYDNYKSTQPGGTGEAGEEEGKDTTNSLIGAVRKKLGMKHRPWRRRGPGRGRGGRPFGNKRFGKVDGGESVLAPLNQPGVGVDRAEPVELGGHVVGETDEYEYSDNSTFYNEEYDEESGEVNYSNTTCLYKPDNDPASVVPIPYGHVARINEVKGNSSCASWCKCVDNNKDLLCDVIGCINDEAEFTKDCSHAGIIKKFGWYTFLSNRGMCTCYGGVFVCERPESSEFMKKNGAYLVLGYSEKEAGWLQRKVRHTDAAPEVEFEEGLFPKTVARRLSGAIKATDEKCRLKMIEQSTTGNMVLKLQFHGLPPTEAPETVSAEEGSQEDEEGEDPKPTQPVKPMWLTGGPEWACMDHLEHLERSLKHGSLQRDLLFSSIKQVNIINTLDPSAANCLSALNSYLLCCTILLSMIYGYYFDR